jgi:hypothetical protein
MVLDAKGGKHDEGTTFGRNKKHKTLEHGGAARGFVPVRLRFPALFHKLNRNENFLRA